VKWCCPNSEAFVLMNFACPNLSQGRTLLTTVSLEAKEPRTRERFTDRERAMAVFEGSDRNRNIMIAVVVVVIAVIAILYAGGWLPKF
jgi:hypothetical protein